MNMLEILDEWFRLVLIDGAEENYEEWVSLDKWLRPTPDPVITVAFFCIEDFSPFY